MRLRHFIWPGAAILFALCMAPFMRAQDAKMEAPKPPTISEAQQAAFDAATIKLNKAQAAYNLAKAASDLLAEQEALQAAINDAQRTCGAAFMLAGNQGKLFCAPAPKAEAIRKP